MLYVLFSVVVGYIRRFETLASLRRVCKDLKHAVDTIHPHMTSAIRVSISVAIGGTENICGNMFGNGEYIHDYFPIIEKRYRNSYVHMIKNHQVQGEESEVFDCNMMKDLSLYSPEGSKGVSLLSRETKYSDFYDSDVYYICCPHRNIIIAKSKEVIKHNSIDKFSTNFLIRFINIMCNIRPFNDYSVVSITTMAPAISGYEKSSYPKRYVLSVLSRYLSLAKFSSMVVQAIKQHRASTGSKDKLSDIEIEGILGGVLHTLGYEDEIARSVYTSYAKISIRGGILQLFSTMVGSHDGQCACPLCDGEGGHKLSGVLLW